MDNQKEWGGWLSMFGIGMILTIIEIILFIILPRNAHIMELKIMGAIMWILAIALWIIPVVIFSKKGNINNNDKNYMNTNTLISTGIYCIIRHPQYLAFILFSTAIMLIAQSWIFVLLGVPAIVLTYLGIQQQDQFLVEKFGNKYKEYMNKVPGINLISGLFKLWINKLKDSKKN